jgi:hypothetical protein
MGQAATKRHNMVVADILFEKEKIRRNSVNTYRPVKGAVHKNANDFVSSKPYNTPPLQPSTKYWVACRLVFYHLLFGFGTLIKRERMNRLIMAGEISVVYTRMGKPSLVFR